MAIKNIDINEASPEQRRAFATNFLNLDLPSDASDDTVFSAIRQAQPNVSMIFFEEADALVAANPANEKANEEVVAGSMQGSLGRDDPRWEIEIPAIETEDGSGARDVLVGVNGRAWQIKRSVIVSLPHRVVLVLENAMQGILEHNMETGDDIRREARRVPFQVHSRPSKEEIEAWDERVKDEFCA